MTGDRRQARRLLAGGVAFSVLVGTAFIAAPGMDRAVAGLFHGAGSGFGEPFGAAGLWARRAMNWLFAAACVAAAVGLVLALLRRQATLGISWRGWAFAGAVFALGPGLLVNGLFKAHWGRPRPRHLTQFGGSMDHMPPFLPGGTCPSNCSFPSGEASAMFALAFVVLLLFPGRRGAILTAFAMAGLMALLRVGQGGHFLSDVLIAGGLMAALAGGTWLVLDPEGEIRGGLEKSGRGG
jgi:lipid A 4'-phosphatase